MPTAPPGEVAPSDAAPVAPTLPTPQEGVSRRTPPAAPELRMHAPSGAGPHRLSPIIPDGRSRRPGSGHAARRESLPTPLPRQCRDRPGRAALSAVSPGPRTGAGSGRGRSRAPRRRSGTPSSGSPQRHSAREGAPSPCRSRCPLLLGERGVASAVGDLTATLPGPSLAVLASIAPRTQASSPAGRVRGSIAEDGRQCNAGTRGLPGVSNGWADR